MYYWILLVSSCGERELQKECSPGFYSSARVVSERESKRARERAHLIRSAQRPLSEDRVVVLTLPHLNFSDQLSDATMGEPTRFNVIGVRECR